MKSFFASLSGLVLLVFFFVPEMVRAQDNPDDQGISFQTFYDDLSDMGTWIQTDDYGYVFQPNVSDPDWAPYTDGHWVSTDEGWAWVSDEPWGWATYHYGRWANIDDVGWVWVPGYRWAPAWVSWRYGNGYAGWAPLPPETLQGEEYDDSGGPAPDGYHFGDDVDVSFHIGPGYYNFVHVEDLGDPNYRGRYADRSNNFVIINNTTNITNLNVNGNRGRGTGGGNFQAVSAGGPSLSEVNAHSRQHVQTVQLTQASQAGPSTLHGNSLAVFAPRINPATAQQARPATVGQSVNHPAFNRGDSITRPLDISSAVKARPPTPQAIQTAQAAQANAPAHAKIATEKTPIKTPLNKPLPAFSPSTNPASPGAGSPQAPAAFHPQAQANSPVTSPAFKPAAQPQQPSQASEQALQQQQAQARQQAEQQQQQSQARQEAQQQQQQSQARQEAQQQHQQEQPKPQTQPEHQQEQPKPQAEPQAPKPQPEQKAQPQKEDRKDNPKPKSSGSSTNAPPGH